MQILGFLAALIIGLCLGVIGGGGSILTVPVLVYLFHLSPAVATSYSLFIVGTTSFAGAINNYYKKQVSLTVALLFGASSVITVLITRRYVLPIIPNEIGHIGQVIITKGMATMILFALLMLVSSIAMIRSVETEIDVSNVNGSKSSVGKNVKLLLYGLLVGVITGLLGAGGGFLLIPVLVLLVKLPIEKAIGTSLFIIALNSLIGFCGDVGRYEIDWPFLISNSILTIVGVVIGTFLRQKIQSDILRKGFGWFVLLMAVLIIYQELKSF